MIDWVSTHSGHNPYIDIDFVYEMKEEADTFQIFNLLDGELI